MSESSQNSLPGTHPGSSGSGHIPVLDGVRGIAILLVLCVHMAGYVGGVSTWIDRIFFRVMGLGWSGVTLFFVLSGFLITGILLNTHGSKGYFRKFYARRSLRIFPLYYLFILSVWLFQGLYRPDRPALAGEPAMFLLYVQNYWQLIDAKAVIPGVLAPTWSLAVEEQFYLAWPLLIYLSGPRRALYVTIAVIAAAWASRFLMLAVADPARLTPSAIFVHMDALAAGALVAVLARGARGAEWLRRTAVPAMAVAGTLVFAIFWYQGHSEPYTPLVIRFGHGLLAIFFAAFLSWILAAPQNARRVRWLSASWLRQMGKYSYAIYLTHYLAIRIVYRGIFRGLWEGDRLPEILGSQIPVQLALFIPVVGISFLIALVSWNLFEKHFLSLKRHFTAEATKVASPAMIKAETLNNAGQ